MPTLDLTVATDIGITKQIAAEEFLPSNSQIRGQLPRLEDQSSKSSGQGALALSPAKESIGAGPQKLNKEMQEMFSKIKIAALSAAVVLSTAFSASATTKHHRATHAHPAIYNMVSAAAGGGCTASGGPACSSACTGSGPCASPDSW